MVEVVKETGDAAAANTNPTNIIQWVFSHIFTLVFVALIIGLIIALYIMWKNWQDDLKKRDHPIYMAYCNIVDSCKANAIGKWIDCKYAWRNLFLLGIPLMWNEHSAKLRNKDNQVMGFYRGHFVAQDGYMNILYYKSRSWLIFEDVKVLRCPYVIKYKHKSDAENPKKVTKIEKLDFRDQIKFTQNGDIWVNCFGTEIYSYFTYPVYLNSKFQPIDLKLFLGEDNVELGQGELVSQVYEQGATIARKGMEHNPNVNQSRLSDSKVKDGTGEQ